MVAGEDDAVRASTVRGGRSATSPGGPDKATHSADVCVALGIDDVHARIGYIGEIVPLGFVVDPGLGAAQDGVARHRDRAEEGDLSVPIGRTAPAFATAMVLAPLKRERWEGPRRPLGIAAE